MRGAAKVGDVADQRGAARVGRGASGCILMEHPPPGTHHARENDGAPVQVHTHQDRRQKPEGRPGEEAHDQDEGMRAEAERGVRNHEAPTLKPRVVGRIERICREAGQLALPAIEAGNHAVLPAEPEIVDTGQHRDEATVRFGPLVQTAGEGRGGRSPDVMELVVIEIGALQEQGQPGGDAEGQRHGEGETRLEASICARGDPGGEHDAVADGVHESAQAVTGAGKPSERAVTGIEQIFRVHQQCGEQEASQCPRLDDQPGGRKPGADRRHRGDFVPDAQAIQDADDPFEIEDPEDADVEIAPLWRELVRSVGLGMHGHRRQNRHGDRLRMRKSGREYPGSVD